MTLSEIVLFVVSLTAWLVYVGLLLLWQYENRKLTREIKAVCDDLVAKWQAKGAEYSQEEVK